MARAQTLLSGLPFLYHGFRQPIIGSKKGPQMKASLLQADDLSPRIISAWRAETISRLCFRMGKGGVENRSHHPVTDLGFFLRPLFVP